MRKVLQRVDRIERHELSGRWYGWAVLDELDANGAKVGESSQPFKFQEEPTEAEVRAIAEEWLTAERDAAELEQAEPIVEG